MDQTRTDSEPLAILSSSRTALAVREYPAGSTRSAVSPDHGGDACPNASGQPAALPVGLGELVRFPMLCIGRRDIAVRWPGVKVLVEHSSVDAEAAALAIARLPLENAQLRAENEALRSIIKNAAEILELHHG